MVKESDGFGRRDFLKLGLAAGLVAGILTGLIPKTGKTKALAKVGSYNLGVIPPTFSELLMNT